ncbi:MAG TPA: nuclear transport factor 2 family protein [Trebonia sp.]
MTDPLEALLLRAMIDAVLADWAWHLDHGDYAAVAALFTEDALFVPGAVELRGRPAIANRYTERKVARSTRHTYSGLRVSPVSGNPVDGGPVSGGTAFGAAGDPDARPARVRAQSTWVSYAVNGPVPVDDVGVYLVADFHDVLTLCDDDQWRISERRIVPVFRDPSRAPA